MTMRRLNLKLFAVAFISAVVEVALIFYFGWKGVTVLPKWGLITLGVVGVIMTVSMLLFIIRKITGADKWDNI